MDTIQVLEDQKNKLKIIALSTSGEARAQYIRAIAEMSAAIVVLQVEKFRKEIEGL